MRRMTSDIQNKEVSEVLLEFAPREVSLRGNQNEVTQKFKFGNLAIITCTTEQKFGFCDNKKEFIKRRIKIEPCGALGRPETVIEFADELDKIKIDDAIAKLIIRSYDGHPWTLHWALDYCVPVLFLARCEKAEDSAYVLERIYVPIAEDRYGSLDNCEPGYPSIEITKRSEFAGNIKRFKKPFSIDGKCPLCKGKIW